MVLMRPIAVLFVLLSVALLFSQFTRLSVGHGDTTDLLPTEKINLALRRTAHQLLAQAGDTTSRIQPAQQLTPTLFQIRLERPFAYKTLPTLLQQSLQRQGIERPYDVSLLDCRNGELQLGYSLLDFRENGTVPCADRQQVSGCYTLRVSFDTPTPARHTATDWLGWLAGFLLLGSACALWISAAKPSGPDVTATNNRVDVGQTSFCLTNQSVVVAGQSSELTYREAKLLNLFIQHPNQLLERTFILKAVWEDEGIIVGRSVDVFVSRLRKLLQPDASLRIVTVHGVGYRLEVIGMKDQLAS
jgi:DNA-binding winged helix-turn-helix (wHTH) protein